MRPIELLFNLEHPDKLTVITKVDDITADPADDSTEPCDNGEEPTKEEADASEDELLKRFDRMTFVVATRKLEQLPPLLPGKLTPLHPEHFCSPGGLMEQSNAALQRGRQG